MDQGMSFKFNPLKEIVNRFPYAHDWNGVSAAFGRIQELGSVLHFAAMVTAKNLDRVLRNMFALRCPKETCLNLHHIKSCDTLNAKIALPKKCRENYKNLNLDNDFPLN